MREISLTLGKKLMEILIKKARLSLYYNKNKLSSYIDRRENLLYLRALPMLSSVTIAKGNNCGSTKGLASTQASGGDRRHPRPAVLRRAPGLHPDRSALLQPQGVPEHRPRVGEYGHHHRGPLLPSGLVLRLRLRQGRVGLVQEGLDPPALHMAHRALSLHGLGMGGVLQLDHRHPRHHLPDPLPAVVRLRQPHALRSSPSQLLASSQPTPLRSHGPPTVRQSALFLLKPSSAKTPVLE